MSMLNVDESDLLFDEWFAHSRVMSILRGYDEATTLSLSRRAWDTGFALVEVPLSDPTADAILARTAAEGRSRGRVVGAGSVKSVDTVARAREAGAAFTVAPGWDPDVAAASLSAGMPHLAGVMTPSDITAAQRMGFRWLKLFPASVLGPAMVRALLGPFPDLKLVATGGVNEENAEDFLAAGVSAVSLSAATRTITAAHVRALSTRSVSSKE
ncbi:bifunctional 4-hydroxy-2-oxoglutarate aldolase/2-dehydro-3-deoxy-phosphogluconate aldolase [Microbacterium sp. R86528]|uniref:bifunctional 4-hydroxy-2-oxoglutarate aldolase/2-dehydro-3-deoxy-phosphogluconate aldolase n=1 Tax=Microbacterium sp. R86528 TaxID=3093864 RepID=UPI0037CC593B